MKTIITLAVGIVFWVNGFGQVTFQRLYSISPFTFFNDISPTPDGGYITLGETNNTGDYFLIKMDATGNVQWAKQIGSLLGIETGYKIGVTIAGGYYLLGKTTVNFSYEEVNLIIFNSAGDILSNKIYRAGIESTSWMSYGRPSIRQEVTGEFIISSAVADNTGDKHFYIKTDASGNLVWSKLFSRTGWGKGGYFDIEIASEVGYIGVGYETHYGIYVTHIDNSGNAIWGKIYTTTGTTRIFGQCIKKVSDGTYIIAGLYREYISNGHRDCPFLIKIDQNGSFLWAKKYGKINMSGTVSVLETSDGGFVSVMNPYTSNSNFPILMRTNAAGVFQWAKYFTLGVSSFVGQISIKETPDGGFVIGASSVDTLTANRLGYLIKIDSLGNSGCYESSLVLSDTSFIMSVNSNIVSSPSNISDSVTFISANATVSASVNCYNDVGISRLSEKNSTLSLSPNPATTEITITPAASGAETKIVSVEIYDVLGKEISKVQIAKGKNKIDVSKLSPGIYFVNIATHEGTVTRKLIKQ